MIKKPEQQADQSEQKPPTEIFSTESWEVARNYSGLLGVVPSSFSSVVRALANDDVRGMGLTEPTRFLIERLARSRSVKACLYFGAITFHNDKVKQASFLSPANLINLYSPGELAVMIGMPYLFRRSKRLCDPGQFAYLINKIQTSIDYGGHVGYSIPAIGANRGLLTGGMPYLGLAPFLFYDKKGFAEYVRHLRTQRVSVDYEYENQRWSCTSLQVASVLVQALGLGVKVAHSFAVGLSPMTSLIAEQEAESLPFQLASVWITSLQELGDIPKIVHRTQFYPTSEALKKLKEQVRGLRESGSGECWILRGRNHVTPENCPQLFRADTPKGAEEETELPTEADQLDVIADEVEHVLDSDDPTNK